MKTERKKYAGDRRERGECKEKRWEREVQGRRGNKRGLNKMRRKES